MKIVKLFHGKRFIFKLFFAIFFSFGLFRNINSYMWKSLNICLWEQVLFFNLVFVIRSIFILFHLNGFFEKIFVWVRRLFHLYLDFFLHAKSLKILINSYMWKLLNCFMEKVLILNYFSLFFFFWVNLGYLEILILTCGNY